MATRIFNSAKYGTVTVTFRSRSDKTIYIVDKVITDDEASIIQLEMGYHPCGYGFYGFKTTETTSTWYRYNSCD
jgi:hypothetical protein